MNKSIEKNVFSLIVQLVVGCLVLTALTAHPDCVFKWGDARDLEAARAAHRLQGFPAWTGIVSSTGTLPATRGV